MTHIYHLQTPRVRHTVHSKDHAITLYLDEKYQLRIRQHHARKPYVLDAVAVLALANMLRDEYASIVQEAKKFNGIGKGGSYAYDDL